MGIRKKLYGSASVRSGVIVTMFAYFASVNNIFAVVLLRSVQDNGLSLAA
jgi:hypothetical protein